MEQLSAADASMLSMETANAPNHFAALMIYDQSSAPGGSVTFKGVLAEIERRLHLARAFRQKMVRVPLDLDDPYWIEDADFDLEYHVRHVALPKPGDWRQFCIQAARLHARPIDMSRPAWELDVIEGLDNVDGLPGGSFAMVLKMHHAAVDGMSGAEMISALHGLSPDAAPPAPERSWRPEPVPSNRQLLARAAVNGARRPLHLPGMLARTAGGLVPPTKAVEQVRNRDGVSLLVPRTRFNGVVSSHRVVDGRRFPIAGMKRIKAAVPGATINDVALTVVAGAMRAYLAAKGELPDASLVSLVPISTRKPGDEASLGNQVEMARVSLRTDIAEPLERLAAIRESTRKLKERPESLGARALLDVSQLVPGLLMGTVNRSVARAVIGLGRSAGANTTVTNVPGPREPLYFAGARMVMLFAMVPVFNGAGLFHSVSSYVDDFMFSITADRDMLPDPSVYADCISASYEELLAAAS